MKKMVRRWMDIPNLDIEDIANLDIGFCCIYVDTVEFIDVFECMSMMLNVC